MSDDNRLIAFDGVGLIDKASIRQGVRKWSWVRCNISAKHMELSLDRRFDCLASQACQLLILQGIYRHGFVQRSIVPPKMWIQTQFHHCPGCGIAAERIYQIHQHVGSFTVVKVLVHFVPELRQWVGIHKPLLYAVPLLMQILSKVQ